MSNTARITRQPVHKAVLADRVEQYGRKIFDMSKIFFSLADVLGSRCYVKPITCNVCIYCKVSYMLTTF
jgi:hypothetical protein